MGRIYEELLVPMAIGFALGVVTGCTEQNPEYGAADPVARLGAPRSMPRALDMRRVVVDEDDADSVSDLGGGADLRTEDLAGPPACGSIEGAACCERGDGHNGMPIEFYCNGGLTCIINTCRACGALGGPCCPDGPGGIIKGTICAFSACYFTNCGAMGVCIKETYTCGGADEACCGMDGKAGGVLCEAPFLTCVAGFCRRQCGR